MYNHSQGGSWEGRCAGVGLRHNYGPKWGNQTWKDVTERDANPVFMEAAETQ